MNEIQLPVAPSPGGTARAYHPLDESRTADGAIRPNWSYLLEGLEALGPAALQERMQKVRRILRDDGATYTVGVPGEGAVRTWELDLVPYVLGSEEWARVEAGLQERAQLLNLILMDLYGPRELIKSGCLPPEAVFAHAGFLRACQGVQLPGEFQLILHSTDMARLPTGELCVIADRTQTPSGAGYALENRAVLSRVLPSLFRDSHVHRHAHFFQRLRTRLTQLSPNAQEPRVVILTPGTAHENHFEHAYLANYLGFPLVQSRDLIVRNGFLWMRSLDGLARVDVVLRRIDDWYCDPLELKSDSPLGVPGLLEVARAGRVAIANPLGAGVLENPVLLKYLPQLGKRLLGREPRLLSAPTYWCGDPLDLERVVARFDDLIIKPIFRGSDSHSHSHSHSVLPRELPKAEREALLARVKAQPLQFAAQEQLRLSRTPIWTEAGFTSRPTILRSFAVADTVSYAVLPGGLAQVGSNENDWFVSGSVGSINKDAWVVASEREKPAVPVAHPASREDFFKNPGLPSRVVENMFWFGRYAERAESTLRMLRTVYVLLNGPEALAPASRTTLLLSLSEATDTLPGFKGAAETLFEQPEAELRSVLLERGRMGSAASCLAAMLHAAEESKELLSSDTLRVINDVRDALSELEQHFGEGAAAAPEEALDPLVTALMALSGLTHESMIRGVGWRFMEIGRRLERGLQIVTLLRSLLGKAAPEAEQASLLSAALLVLEVLIPYRRRYRGTLDMARGLELTLIDTSNPRSLLYQFERLEEHIGQLPAVGVVSRELQIEARALLEAISTLRLSRLVELAAAADGGERKALVTMLSRQQELLTAISSAVSDKYFDHRIGPQQLVRAVWEE